MRLSLAISLVSLLALGLSSQGCNRPNKKDADASTTAAATSQALPQAPPPGTSASTAPASAPATTTTTTPVGSEYWYEGNTFGNPFKTHSGSEAAFARDVLILTNQERTSRGLPALVQDAEAELAAKIHCEDMAGRGFFDHFTPEGWSPFDRLAMTGASGFTLSGENVAYGQRDPAAVVKAWMDSPGHRANMLHPDFTHLGVGVADGAPHWAQVFLRR